MIHVSVAGTVDDATGMKERKKERKRKVNKNQKRKRPMLLLLNMLRYVNLRKATY